MALVGLTEAARLTGKHPTTIMRAAARGRLSFSINAVGQRQFDTAELDRAYGVKAGNGAAPGAAASELQRSSTLVRENELLAQRVAEQAEVIRTLTQRLDAEAAERRQLSERLTALLTYRHQGSVPAVAAKLSRDETATRPPWWRRWFR
jgi:hypothetical protein